MTAKFCSEYGVQLPGQLCTLCIQRNPFKDKVAGIIKISLTASSWQMSVLKEQTVQRSDCGRKLFITVLSRNLTSRSLCRNGFSVCLQTEEEKKKKSPQYLTVSIVNEKAEHLCLRSVYLLTVG